MKKKQNKVAVAIAALALVGAVGGTIAYFTSSETFENVFKTEKYGTTITETFTSPDSWLPGTTTPKTVSVKNEGKVPVVVRAKIDDSTKGWYNGTSKLTSLTENVTINYKTTSNWTKVGDYYYYTSVLNENDTTADSFIESVTFNAAATLGDSDQTCTYSYTYTENGESKTVTDAASVPSDKKTSSVSKKCESKATSYAGATYKFNITVETMQYSSYKSNWTGAPEITNED